MDDLSSPKPIEIDFEDIFYASPDLVCILDLEHNIIRANQAMTSALGVSPGDLAGSKCFWNMHQTDEPHTLCVHEQMLKDNQNHTIELLIEPLDGWFSVTVAPLRSKDGKIVGAIHIARDITERKKTEEKLLAEQNFRETERKRAEKGLMVSEQRWQFALEGAGDGVWDWNAKTNEVFFSHRWKEMLGYNDDEIGNTIDEWSKRLHPEDSKQCYQDLNSHFENKTPYYQNEHRVLCKDGTYKWILDRGKVFEWHTDGKPLRVIGTHTDITERRQAEDEIILKNEQLNRANAEKDKFFSIIAHDLRSPFQPLLGFTRMLVEDLPTLRLDEIQKMALNMRNSASKLFNLLENLLEWSRMQRGITTFEPESFFILPKLSESLVLILDVITHKEIDLIYEVPGDLAVFADGNMFESVIRNLVSNAIKFTAPKGEITINAKPLNEKWVEISVKDTGIGMNKEMLDNLFKLDTNTNRKGTEGESSSGLGLIICKDFIEKHGGKFWVESEEGKGSTFYFTLLRKGQK